jgi:hypothetical protein
MSIDIKDENEVKMLFIITLDDKSYEIDDASARWSEYIKSCCENDRSTKFIVIPFMSCYVEKLIEFNIHCEKNREEYFDEKNTDYLVDKKRKKGIDLRYKLYPENDRDSIPLYLGLSSFEKEFMSFFIHEDIDGIMEQTRYRKTRNVRFEYFNRFIKMQEIISLWDNPVLSDLILTVMGRINSRFEIEHGCNSLRVKDMPKYLTCGEVEMRDDIYMDDYGDFYDVKLNMLINSNSLNPEKK